MKHFVKHIMELYKNNMQGFSEEFEVPERHVTENHMNLFMKRSLRFLYLFIFINIKKTSGNTSVLQKKKI